MKHLRYLRYLLRHKWFVFRAGLRLRVPIHQLVFHDWHKLLPDEWFPYANYFYGNYPSVQDIHGDQRNWISQYKEDVERDFDRAWLLHQKRSRHHWQSWVLLEDDGAIKPLPMPQNDIREMVADWMGAGKALNNLDVGSWYLHNRHKMRLHLATRSLVERLVSLSSCDLHPDVVGWRLGTLKG